jgi:hypothetical protein
VSESESARVTSAAEARFRINYPNSQPRAVKVIALDAASEKLVDDIAKDKWNRAAFFTASAFSESPAAGDRFSMQGWLSDLAGRTKDLIAEIDSADLVVMVASAGASADAASIIGEACWLRKVMTTGLIVGSAAQSDAALAKTLAQLRPHTQMLVIASDDDYIKDMLTALRA